MSRAANLPRPHLDAARNPVALIDQAVADLPIDEALGVLAAATARLTLRLHEAKPSNPSTSAIWADAKQVAEMFHVPESQIYALARQGRIPHVKLGKYTRFNVAELQRVLPISDGAKLGPLRPEKPARKRSNGAASRASVSIATALLPETTGSTRAN
jgi:excisionase family DNA binding protein